MKSTIEPIALKSCPKAYNRDLDKAAAPAETIAKVQERVGGQDILAGVRRIDTGRLGIPVYLGICGPTARKVMPTRKQMGKGSSPEQAQASAIMELMERYAFFTFWENPEGAVRASWSEAEKMFGADLVPVTEILRSVNDTLDQDTARELLNLRQWLFYPATDLATGKIVWLPIDWFRLLGEFNGSSAGNTAEESLLQGAAELIERHVCCIVDRKRPELPTIDQNSINDPALGKLCAAFTDNGINLILKDLTMGMPMPTVGALAWDPATFPNDSEIVFTAGTATSPAKAAIRAVTEVAQLGGDFCTHSCYEASGLPKFKSLEQCGWLLKGPNITLDSLTNASDSDIYTELRQVVGSLAPVRVFAIDTTSKRVDIPAHWSIAPGLEFRERDKNQSLGLFLGRLLAEQEEPVKARDGLAAIAKAYPDAPYLPFFAGMIKLREGEFEQAAAMFSSAAAIQPDADSRALAYFYAGYALTQAEKWQEAAKPLEQSLAQAPDLREAANLLGVCCFKLQQYAQAEQYFTQALDIDKGSAMDLANRGIARKFQGKKAEAVHDLEAALELDSSLDFARKHLEELAAA